MDDRRLLTVEEETTLLPFLLFRCFVVLQGNLRHQLLIHNAQHPVQLFCLLRSEPGLNPIHNFFEIIAADVIVVHILFCGPQMILPSVIRGLHLFHISLLDQTVHLVCRIG